MFARTLLTAGFCSAMAVAQETPSPEPSKPEPTPSLKPATPQKTCSVPLINVTPPARPFMPRMRIRAQIDPKIIIPPPAPACEDDREGTPVSRRKDPKPVDPNPSPRP
jgi:hypothetical protein